MPLLLSAIPWRLVAILGVCAGLFFGVMYVTSQLKKIGRLEAQLDSAIEVSNANAEIALKATAEAQRVQALMLAGSKAKGEIRRKAATRRTQINETLPSDDGPLAPVLRLELDSLQPSEGPEGIGTTSVSTTAP